jgi:hypothetical protein
MDITNILSPGQFVVADYSFFLLRKNSFTFASHAAAIQGGTL